MLDPSNDMVTRKIIDRLDASEYFTVAARFHSPQEMEAAFLKSEVDMAVVLVNVLWMGFMRAMPVCS